MACIPMKRSREEFDATINSMANYLMLMSGGSTGSTNNDTYENNLVSRVFECKTCNRQFSSFQALGGHRASHKKPRLIVDGEQLDIIVPTKPKTHKCSICGIEFAIGQALGGHMRRHRAETKTENNYSSDHLPVDDMLSKVVKKVNSRRVFSLDLNLTPLENDFDDLEKVTTPITIDFFL